MRSVRSRVAALVGMSVVGVSVLAPAAAHAAPGDDVLVFSNSNVVDTSAGVDGGEYEWISAALADAGYDVTPFDGGDGSESAWTTALTDIEVFVLPEQEAGDFYDPLNPPSWLSADAHDALVAWIRAGGAMLQSSACDPSEVSVLSAAVGVDYSDVVDCSVADPAPRWIDDASLPAALDGANGTYGMNLTDMSLEQRGALSVWYAGTNFDECDGAATESLAAGVFTAGTGRVAFEAWDYYNDSSNDQASWNAVLAALIDGNSSSSLWTPASPPPSPEPKEPVTATTEAGDRLFTVSPFTTCESEHSLFRIDPDTALAAPVGDSEISGDATQGAWDATTETAYFPFDDFEQGEYFLMTVDPETGEFTAVGEFDVENLDFFDEVFSLAIGPDGEAYLMAALEIGDDYYDLALLSVDLSTASLTFIAEIDDSELDEPNGFAADPTTGKFYAFEEDSLELFEVNVSTGSITALGTLESDSITEDTDVTALQIAEDGTFWVVFDEAESSTNDDAGMLATFTLADIGAGAVVATEVGIITDGPIPSWSLLVVPGAPELAATGVRIEAGVALALALMLLGLVLAFAMMRRREVTPLD